jgi:DUF1365 family protein
VHIENREHGASVFDATLSLKRRALSPDVMRSLLRRYPALSMQVSAGIYIHALRLWRKGATHHSHPVTA